MIDNESWCSHFQKLFPKKSVKNIEFFILKSINLSFNSSSIGIYVCTAHSHKMETSQMETIPYMETFLFTKQYTT